LTGAKHPKLNTISSKNNKKTMLDRKPIAYAQTKANEAKAWFMGLSCSQEMHPAYSAAQV